MRRLWIWPLIGLAIGALAALLAYSGVFDVTADTPHSALVYAVIETVWDRSIAVRAAKIQVPPLDDPKLIGKGAGHYDAMCSACHLAPGVKRSEIRDGLSPQPPDLTERTDVSSAEMFWIIKHGIKMSAMPAWGKTHDDPSIWAIVAFLHKLPDLTAAQYQTLVESNAEADHHRHEHEGHSEHGIETPGHHHDQGGGERDSNRPR